MRPKTCLVVSNGLADVVFWLTDPALCIDVGFLSAPMVQSWMARVPGAESCPGRRRTAMIATPHCQVEDTQKIASKPRQAHPGRSSIGYKPRGALRLSMNAGESGRTFSTANAWPLNLSDRCNADTDSVAKRSALIYPDRRCIRNLDPVSVSHDVTSITASAGSYARESLRVVIRTWPLLPGYGQ